MFDMIALIYGRPQISIDYKKGLYITHSHKTTTSLSFIKMFMTKTGRGSWSEKLKFYKFPDFSKFPSCGCGQ